MYLKITTLSYPKCRTSSDGKCRKETYNMYIIRKINYLAHFPIEESTKSCLKNASPKCSFALNSPLSAVLSPQLALSSDKISSLQTPLLNLSLDVRENGALRTVSVEMNREEFHMLISSLEAANKVHTLLNTSSTGSGCYQSSQ